MTKSQKQQGTPKEQKDEHNKTADALAQQARDLLAGKTKWKPTWVDYGDELEVERNVRIWGKRLKALNFKKAENSRCELVFFIDLNMARGGENG